MLLVVSFVKGELFFGLWMSILDFVDLVEDLQGLGQVRLHHPLLIK